MNIALKTAALTGTLVVALSAFAAGNSFTIEAGKVQNVTFHSKAPLESFDGTTSSVSGIIDVDPMNLDSASGTCRVDMATLDTGIGLRNQHMRENHLNTDKYPEAVFQLISLSGADKLESGNEVSLEAHGKFTLHGVTRDMVIPATAIWYPDASSTVLKSSGSALHITGEFQVVLPDYEIPRPEFLFLKVAESQRVTLDVWARTEE